MRDDNFVMDAKNTDHRTVIKLIYVQQQFRRFINNKNFVQKIKKNR